MINSVTIFVTTQNECTPKIVGFSQATWCFRALFKNCVDTYRHANAGYCSPGEAVGARLDLPRKETSSEPRPQRLRRPRLWTQRRGQRRWGLLSDQTRRNKSKHLSSASPQAPCMCKRQSDGASGATKARHSDQCHQVTESSDGDESLSTQCMAASRKHTLTDSRMQCSRRPSPRLEAVH